jgi:hypothetical protein
MGFFHGLFSGGFPAQDLVGSLGQASGEKIVDEVVEDVGFYVGPHGGAFAQSGPAGSAAPSGRRTYRKQVNSDSMGFSPEPLGRSEYSIGEGRGVL